MGIQRLRLTSLFLFLLSFSAAYSEEGGKHRYGIPEKLARVDGKKQVDILEAKVVNAKYKGNPSKAVKMTSHPATVNTTELTKYNILSLATARVSSASNAASAYDNLVSLETEYSSVGLTRGAFSSSVPGADSFAARDPEPTTTHQIPTFLGVTIPVSLPLNPKEFEKFKSGFIQEASEEMSKLATAADNQRKDLKKLDEANRKTEKDAQEAEKEIAQLNKDIEDNLKKEQEAKKAAAAKDAGHGGGDKGKGAKDDEGDSVASKFGEGTPKAPDNSNLFSAINDGGEGSRGFDPGAFTGGLGANANNNPGGLPEITLPNSSGNNLLRNLLGQNQNSNSNSRSTDLGSKTPGVAIANEASPFKGAPQEPPAVGGAVKGSLGAPSGGSAPDVSADSGGKYTSYNPFKTYAVGNDGPGASEEAGGPVGNSSEDNKNFRKGNSEIFYSSDSEANRPRGILESFVGKIRFLCSDAKNKDRIGVCTSDSSPKVQPNNAAILSAITDLPM